MNLSASQRCEFVKNTPDCTSDDGFIKYPVVTFCLFPPNLLPLAITLYVRTVSSVTKLRVYTPVIECCVSLFVECDMFLFTYPAETNDNASSRMCNLILYWLCWFCMLLKSLSRFLFPSFLLFLSGHLVVCSVPSSWADCIRLVSGEFERITRVINRLGHTIWWSNSSVLK